MSDEPTGVIEVYNVKDFGAKGDGMTLEDVSETTRPNQIIGCTFKTNDFDLGNVNDKILKNYVITDCLAWGNYGHERFTPTFIVNDTDYQIKYETQIIWKIEFPIESVDYQIILPPGISSELNIKLEIGHTLKIFRHLNQGFQRDLIISTLNEEGLINDTGPSVVILATETPQIITKIFIYLGKNDSGQDLWRMI